MRNLPGASALLPQEDLALPATLFETRKLELAVYPPNMLMLYIQRPRNDTKLLLDLLTPMREKENTPSGYWWSRYKTGDYNDALASRYLSEGEVRTQLASLGFNPGLLDATIPEPGAVFTRWKKATSLATAPIHIGTLQQPDGERVVWVTQDLNDGSLKLVDELHTRQVMISGRWYTLFFWETHTAGSYWWPELRPCDGLEVNTQNKRHVGRAIAELGFQPTIIDIAFSARRRTY